MREIEKTILILASLFVIPMLLSCDVDTKTHYEYTEDIIMDVSEKPYEPEPEPEEESELEMTENQAAALDKAISYVNTISYSYNRLMKQLVQDGFSLEDSMFAADNCGADWDEQAAWRVATYFTFTGFSYGMVVEQLIYDGFTEEQAYFAADNCGADWDEQAVYRARSYIKAGIFKGGQKQKLVSQLVLDGFTEEQAEEAVSHVWFG